MFEDNGITKSQQYGGIGESATEMVLKLFSQVFRPVPLFEYSIDFYCRLLDRGKPSNKTFWVEVKSTNSVNDKWKRSIKRETALFWLNQLAPVFIVVYDLSSDIIYWVSVEDNRKNWSSKLEKNAKSITLKVVGSQVLNKKKDKNKEFAKKIQEDTIHVNAVNGIPEVIHVGGKGSPSGYSFFAFPNIELSERARGAFQQKIRLSLNFLLRDACSRKVWSDAYQLAKILTIFDKSHYDHFELMGDICAVLGSPTEALNYYDQAIEMFRQDPNWDKNRTEGISSVSENIQRIQQKKVELKDKDSI